MKPVLLYLFAAASLMAGPRAAVARDTLTLQPSSRWELDYAKDSCALRRTFGQGKELAQLELRRFQPGTSLLASVFTNASKTTSRDFRFRWNTDADWTDISDPLYATMADSFGGVFFGTRLFDAGLGEEEEDATEEWFRYFQENDVRTIEGEAAQAINSILVAKAFRADLNLETGSLKAPIDALNACVEELMNHWGIDVEAHKTLSRPAIPVNLDEIPRMIDYPPKMLRMRMPGLVNIRLDVSDTGRITQCHIQMPLSDPAFEETSCADIQHALDFDPALDKDGNPIASYWITSVRFRIG